MNKFILYLLMFCTCNIFAQTNLLLWSDNGSYVTITGHMMTIESHLDIPDDIGGFPVSVIETNAFYNYTPSFSLTCSTNITSIKDRAFSNSGLNYISTMPLLNSLGIESFKACTNLTEFLLTGHAPTLSGEKVFYNSGLISIIVDYQYREEYGETFGRIPVSYFGGPVLTTFDEISSHGLYIYEWFAPHPTYGAVGMAISSDGTSPYLSNLSTRGTNMWAWAGTSTAMPKISAGNLQHPYYNTTDFGFKCSMENTSVTSRAWSSMSFSGSTNSLYHSFLLRVDDLSGGSTTPTWEQSFFHLWYLCDNDFIGCRAVNSSQYKLRFSNTKWAYTNDALVYESPLLSTGVVYFIVGGIERPYETTSTWKIWIDPVLLGESEPPISGSIPWRAVSTNYGYTVIMGDNDTNTADTLPTMYIDELKIGIDYQTVTAPYIKKQTIKPVYRIKTDYGYLLFK